MCVALVVAVGAASASHLEVDAVSLSVSTAEPGCALTAEASAEDPHGPQKFEDVRVVLPAGCGGRVQVSVIEDDARIGSYDAPVTAGGVVLLDDIGNGGYRPEHVAVVATLDGWDLPVTWSYTPLAPVGPIYPGNGDTVTTDLEWTSITSNPVQGCFSVDVSTTSTTPVVWRITLDLARAPFNGATTGYSIQGSDSWRYAQYAATPSAGYLQIGGTADVSAGRRTIVAGQTYEVSVCHWSLPPGAQTPSAYSVSTVQGTWTAARACLVTTVTGNGSSQFYVGWTVQLDMQSAVNRLQSAGRTFDALTYSANHSEQTWTPAPGVGPNAFTVVSTSAANIRLSQSYVFETCAVDW